MTNKSYTIYLVWGKKKGKGIYGTDSVELRAVDTNKDKAKIHESMLKQEDGYVSSYIEEQVTNHLFGSIDIGYAMALSKFKKRDGD